jgi:hypothetical protein
MASLRTSCLAVVCCLLLAACDPGGPTFDTSSVPAYQKSLREIEAPLSAAERHRLEVALVALAAGGGADYVAFSKFDQTNVTELAALDGVANSAFLLERMRSRIAGKTATAVIRRVADDIDIQISGAESQRQSVGKELKAIIIDNARFSWNRGITNPMPIMQFDFYNGSRIPVSAVLLNATLTAPGVRAPLAVGSLAYRFPNPLQPGVQQKVTINLGNSGIDLAQRLADVYNVDLAIKVTNIDQGDGKRLMRINADVLDVLEQRRDLLRGG